MRLPFGYYTAIAVGLILLSVANRNLLESDMLQDGIDLAAGFMIGWLAADIVWDLLVLRRRKQKGSKIK